MFTISNVNQKDFQTQAQLFKVMFPPNLFSILTKLGFKILTLLKIYLITLRH